MYAKKYDIPVPSKNELLLYAMGDGNHSFATGKLHWEKTKKAAQVCFTLQLVCTLQLVWCGVRCACPHLTLRCRCCMHSAGKKKSAIFVLRFQEQLSYRCVFPSAHCVGFLQEKGESLDDLMATHPARYALVEIVNIHDEGLEFEGIHRVLFNVAEGSFFEKMKAWFAAKGSEVTTETLGDLKEAARIFEKTTPAAAKIGYVTPAGVQLPCEPTSFAGSRIVGQEVKLPIAVCWNSLGSRGLGTVSLQQVARVVI